MSGILDRTPSAVIRQLLVDLGLGTNPDDDGDWPVFAVSYPDSPDNLICATDTDPVKGGREMVEGESLLHYGIQVAIRTNDPQVGVNKAWQIADDFDKRVLRRDVTLGSNTYRVQSVNQGGVINAGREPTSKRRLFTINALTSMRQLTGTGTGTA